MTKERRQQLLLGGLLVVLAFVMVRTVFKIGGSGGGTGGRAGVFRSAPQRGSTVTSTGSEIVDLRLEDLERKPAEFEPGRDPFRYKPKAQPRQSAPRAPAPQQRRPRPKPRQPAQAARPQPPEPDFVFLGTFGPEERPIAVFSDQTEIFNVFEGGVLKDKFVVRKIGLESADIGFVEFPDAPVRRLAVGG